MFVQVFIALILFSFGIFIIPRRFQFPYALTLTLVTAALTSYWAFDIMQGNRQFTHINFHVAALQSSFILIFDKLSAFFVLVVNLTVVVGLLYARGYLKPYCATKNTLSFAIHYFAFIWLYFSMLLVLACRDGISFLIVWEVMAVSSFLLVIFDAEDRNIMKTGINYLVQMHIGMVLLLIALLIVEKSTGSMSFDALADYFSQHRNWPLFLLFFAGFGIKAGFIPLHTWLPQAHPAAPSHVSGIMSGVMIKMGIYGIMRVLLSVQHDYLIIGIVLLIVSVISGVLGVMMAIVQHDLKKLLAYHSIENIGIIGIGMGLGVIGISMQSDVLIILGFSGALLHVLNHSLFKSMLFFNAGSVYQAIRTRNIDSMGGLMKKMPFTALLFLLASLAICGLPPFNGFISEYLIYLGMFKSLEGLALYHSVLIVFGIVALTLIGGLAIFCFTKAFGIAFLGEARSPQAAGAKEVSASMLWPQAITAITIVAIGLASAWFVKPLFSMLADNYGIPVAEYVGFTKNLTGISMLAGIFLIVFVALLVLRHGVLRNRPVRTGPVWGCGYTAATPRLQYTASSWADSYFKLAKPLLRTKVHNADIAEDEIFPVTKAYETHPEDAIKTGVVDAPVTRFLGLLKKIAIMQTGQIQHYVLYAFVFMLLIFLLTYFQLI